jgi:hypothetical protein
MADIGDHARQLASAWERRATESRAGLMARRREEQRKRMQQRTGDTPPRISNDHMDGSDGDTPEMGTMIFGEKNVEDEAPDPVAVTQADTKRVQERTLDLANALTPSAEILSSKKKKTRSTEPLASLLSPLFSEKLEFEEEAGDMVDENSENQDGNKTTDRWVQETQKQYQAKSTVASPALLEGFVHSPSRRSVVEEASSLTRQRGTVNSFLKMLEATDEADEKALSATMSRINASPVSASVVDESSSFWNNSQTGMNEKSLGQIAATPTVSQHGEDEWDRQSSYSAYAPSSFSGSIIPGSVRARMTGLTMEVEDKSRTLAAMNKKLRQERLRFRDMEEQIATQEARKIKNVREEYEETIQRHLNFIDRLLADKQTLSEKCDTLATELKRVENMYSGGVGELKERHNDEMKRQKEAWAASEKVRREKWMEEKTREIKTATIKGLEPEVQRILSKHKKEIRRLEDRKEDEVSKVREAIVEKYEESARLLRERLEDEKDEAVAVEHNNWRERLNDVTDDCENRVAEIRSRLEAQLEKQRDRFDKDRQDLVKRQEKEIERILHTELTKREEMESRHTSILEDIQSKQDARMTVESARMVEQRQEWQRLLEDKLRYEAAEKEKSLREKLRKERDAQINDIIDRLDEENDKSTETLTQDYEKKIVDIERRHETAIGDHIKSAAEERKRADRLQRQLDESERRMESLETQIADLRRERSLLKNEVGEATKQADNKEDALRREFAEKRCGDLKEIDVLRVQINRLETQVADHEHDRERLIASEQRKKDDEIDSLEERVRQTISRKDSLNQMLQEQVDDLTVRLKTAEILLEKQRAELLQ